jgi:hypothetical protein
MDTLVIKVKEEKRDFLLQLLEAVDFVEVKLNELSDVE